MPFKSKSQMRYFFAAEKRGELPAGTAKEWAAETPSVTALPRHVGKRPSVKRKSARFYGEK